MAEFQEVMRQGRRLCEECGSCKICPIVRDTDGYARCPFCGEMDDVAIEDKIMNWAKEHPEPVYPTWKEWQDTNFPNNDALMRPCIFESEEYFECKHESGCEKCMNKPIPADIAEKLGVKPIGGRDDENAL